MIRHNLFISYRYFQHKKAFTLSGIFILAAGLAASLLIFLWVENELNSDKFHTKLDRLFLVTGKANPGVEKWNYFAFECANILKDKYPEIIGFASISPLNSPLLSPDDKNWYILNGIATHPDFLTMFNFKLIRGDKLTALNKKNAILLTKQTARKFFGEEDPMGRTIQILERKKMDFEVTGIFDDIPDNSSIKFDYLVYNEPRTWSMMAAEVVLLDKSVDLNKIDELNEKIKDTSQESRYSGDDESIIRLFPFSKVYFDSDYYPFQHGERKYPKIMGIIGIIILFIAVLSFTSLATARTMKRAKDTGIRKVMGATRAQLILQFLTEAFLIIFIATLLGMVFTKLFLPSYNILAEKSFHTTFANKEILLISGFVFLFTFLIAGLLPALLFSSFNPVKSIKGIFTTKNSIRYFREGMVIFLFTCSIILISSTIFLSRQLSYMQHKDLGFEKDNIVKVQIINRSLYGNDRDNYKKMIQYIDDEMNRNPDILITDNGYFPTKIHKMNWVIPVNGIDKQYTVNTISVGYHFAELFGIDMVQGSFFSEKQGNRIKNEKEDRTSYLVINKKAAEVFELKEPVGTYIRNISWGNFKVIGVTDNFNSEHLSVPVKPLMMVCLPYKSNPLLIKIRKGTLAESMKFIEKTFHKANPGLNFEYEFFDQHLDMMYKKDKIIAKIFKYFAIIAIFLAGLSLYSYAAFSTEQRSKEIAIRKINGAHAGLIFGMLSINFIKWVLIAFILGFIISYLPIQNWLENFAYRIDMSYWVFFLAGLISLIIALITVGWQTYKAATQNPVESLRYE